MVLEFCHTRAVLRSTLVLQCRRQGRTRKCCSMENTSWTRPNNVVKWSEMARDKAMTVLAATSASAAKTALAEAVKYAKWASQGYDANGRRGCCSDYR